MFDYKKLLKETMKEGKSFNVRDEYKDMEIHEIRSHQPRLGFDVAVLNITGELNLGNILRSAVIFGASGFYIIGRKKYDRRSTVGAQNYIDVFNMTDPNYFKSDTEFNEERFHSMMDVRLMTPVFCETGGKDIRDIDFSQFKRPPCFVFGNEGIGIQPSLIKEDSIVASIPQVGVMRSLNVAVAAGIIMHEYVRYQHEYYLEKYNIDIYKEEK